MVLPLGDDNSKILTVPGVTIGLIVLNVLVFLWELMHWSQLPQIFYTFGVVPEAYTQLATDASFLERWPVYLTWLTAMFLHGGTLHIFINMLYLKLFGDNVEDAMGHFKFLLFYLLCGIGATFAHVWANPHSAIPSVGASGAVSGILAAYLVLFPKERVVVLLGFLPVELPAITVIGLWFLLQLLSGITSLGAPTAETSGVAYMAHLGGFLVAFPLLWIFQVHRPRRYDA